MKAVMKQEISNAFPPEGSQGSRRTRLPRFVPAAATAAVPGASMSQLLTLSHPRMQFYQRMGWFLTAALVLSFLSAFTSASSAHASGGGFCMNYNNTWSYDGQAIPSTTRPIMYSGGRGVLMSGWGWTVVRETNMETLLSRYNPTKAVLIMDVIVLAIRLTGTNQPLVGRCLEFFPCEQMREQMSSFLLPYRERITTLG
jgi:hypothetical protein